MPPRACARPARTTTVSENPSPPSDLSRRELLAAALAAPLLRAWSHVTPPQGRRPDDLRRAPRLLVRAGDADLSQGELSRGRAGAVFPAPLTHRRTGARG